MQPAEQTIRLGVVIPTLDQTRLLLGLLNSLETRHGHKLFLIDNQQWGLSVAASWNRGIAAAFDWGADMVLVINDDVLLHPRTVDNLVQRMIEEPRGLLCAFDVRNLPLAAEQLLAYEMPTSDTDEGIQDFCCFLLPRTTWETIGPFDEQFTKAYYEDIDYEYRMKQQGLSIYRTRLAPCYHFGSRTGAHHVSTPERDRNRELFRQKWGTVPV